MFVDNESDQGAYGVREIIGMKKTKDNRNCSEGWPVPTLPCWCRPREVLSRPGYGAHIRCSDMQMVSYRHIAGSFVLK